jgi:asparagine synthase (glutamine-hydrolysing)
MQKSIKAWIQPYENIYLSLSGGLDSTSLLFCLKEVLNDNQKLVALNLYHSDFFASCEREYAEKACREAGVSLIKLESSDDLPFSPRQFDLKLLPNKPCMALIGLALQESMYLQMDANKKCIMLSGQGGDHVFMRPPTMLSLTDCILRKKFNIVFKKLFELAHFYREPFFVIIKKNIEECISLDKKRRMVALSYHEQKKPEWFNDRYSMIDESIIDEHWKRFSSIKEPGKKEHIHAILSALSTIEQEWIDTSNPCFFPFLSKPLIDYASKLNTFDLYSFGYDRYQIRKEVSQRYKTNLVWRRDKGETSGMTQLGFRKNLSKINELCLEGYFAQHNLLDKNILHKSILACSNGFKENMNFLINLITAEMFIDGWRSKMKTN